MLNLGHMFGIVCVVLALLTLLVFWFVGIWWGVGCLITSILFILFVLLVAHRFKEDMEKSFKSY